jgi:hypothetical protein
MKTASPDPHPRGPHSGAGHEIARFAHPPIAAPVTELEAAAAFGVFRERALNAVLWEARAALSDKDPARRREKLEAIVRLATAGLADPGPKRIDEIVGVARTKKALETMAAEREQSELSRGSPVRAGQEGVASLEDDKPAPEHVPRPAPRRAGPAF